MVNVIYENVERIDRFTTTVDVDVVNSIEQASGETVLIDAGLTTIQDFGYHTVYVPAFYLNRVKGGKVKVYHELAQYPFFQEAKSIMSSNESPKGVFRLRRLLETEKNDSIIASDLCVLTSLFGEPEVIDVKHSRYGLEPQHVIVTANFVRGTMAHIDYTFSSKESIELEWSGIKQIIEFNSDEMNPMKPSHFTTLPLRYNVDSILDSAEDLDLVAPKLTRFQRVIGGVEA